MIGPASVERFLLAERDVSAPPLTSLSHCQQTSRLIERGLAPLAAPRPLHLARRESYAATPARGAFVLFRRRRAARFRARRLADPTITARLRARLRGDHRSLGEHVDDATQHLDQVALVHSRIPTRDLIPSSHCFVGFGRGAGSAPDRVDLLLLSSPGCRGNNARTQNGEPLHGRREVHPAEVGGQLEVAGSAHRLLRAAHTGRERRIESRMRGWLHVKCGVSSVSPGSLSPGHLVSPSGPAERRNNALRVYDGPKTSTFGSAVPLAGHSCLGNPPREGRDPGEDRGAFRPFDRATHARMAECGRVRGYPRRPSVTRWSSVPRRLVDPDASKRLGDEKENAVPRDRRLLDLAARLEPCDGSGRVKARRV